MFTKEEGKRRYQAYVALDKLGCDCQAIANLKPTTKQLEDLVSGLQKLQTRN